MQRISSWFEQQLPLRRRETFRRQENCDSWPQAVVNHSFSAIQSHNYRDYSVHIRSQSIIHNDQFHTAVKPFSWNRQETETQLWRNSNSKLSTSFSHSSSTAPSYGRKNIRTNPWISRSRPVIQAIASGHPGPKSADRLSTDRTTSFHINSLDESIYSSGYGSQDSSPESSVHSPDWQPSITTGKRGRLEDKAVECNSVDVDEALGLDLGSQSEIEDLKASDTGKFCKNDKHVYYELEVFNQLSLHLDDRTCLSDSEITNSSDGSLPTSRTLSPIYAQPNYDHNDPNYCEGDLVTEYPNVASSFTYIPCTSSCRTPPEFHPPPPPPPPPPYPLQTNDLEQVELDFLTELDAQIAELQITSGKVRRLVDEARERRGARFRNAQLYHDLAELRRMKWALRNHFELEL